MRLNLVAWMALAAGLALTVAAGLEVKKATEHEAAHEFAMASNEIALKIRQRLDAYALVLKGGAGFFAASSSVDRHEWKAYVEKLRTQDSVLGVQGIGFAKVIQPEQLAAHEAGVRAEGFPDYAVRPAGPREFFTSIVFLEPFSDRNMRAFGFDMFSEPVRRAAMEQARDTGRPALSGKVELVQETGTDVQAGTLMYVPVYRNGAPIDTIAERRAALIGWSYSPYRMKDMLEPLFAGIPGIEIDRMAIRVFDGIDAKPGNLLYESRPSGAASVISPLLHEQRIVEFNGRRWLLSFAAEPGNHVISYATAWGTLAAGIVLSSLLCGLILSLGRTQARARQIADGLVAEVRRKAEALQDSELKLRRQTARYQVLLRSSSDGLCVLNAQGYIEETSDSFCSMLGYPRERVIGMHVSEWDANHGRDELGAIVAKIIADGKRVQFETRHRRLDGTIRPVEVSAVPVALDDKDLIFCLTRDIMERKLADQVRDDRREWLECEVATRTQALVAAKDAAEAANIAKSAFLANMSHELRTPMNAIMGMTSLALYRATDAKQIDQLNKVMSATEHLLRLINDVLDISKIVSDKMQLEHVDFRMQDVLDRLVDLVGPTATDRGLALRVQAEPGLPDRVFQGDPTRLGQVLINLVGNAVKFTERGTVTVRARRIDAQADTVLLRWEIADTGIGIAPDAQRRLFAAFEQADNSMTRQYGGTGLGLAISKRLVTLMGGEIGVESTPGQGSTFWFTVRLGKSVSPALPPPALSAIEKPEDLLRSRFAGARVLLVEDDPISRQVGCALLEAVGLVVDLAEDGRRAVELARNKAYALILMDMRMPVMNGIESTQAIRTLPGHRSTPILAMTANAFDEDRAACIEAGMDDHVAKPVSPQRLYGILLRWLEARQAASPDRSRERTA